MADEPMDESPWGEQQWERFLYESDVQSARFGELLDTLLDHPDRDEIIAREMGWDLGANHGEGRLWNLDELLVWDEPPDDEPTEEDLQAVRRERDDLEGIPAYAESYAWSMRVFHALNESERGDDDLDEILAEAIGQGRCIAAKIAGGHGIGYEDDAICGNIVSCKRARKAAGESLRALRELSERRPELRETIAPLIEEGQQIERLVEGRISDLRTRVWWE